MNKDRSGIDLKAQVLLYPVANADLDTPSYLQFAEGYYLTRDGMKWFWDQYTLAGEALLWGIDLHNRTAHAGVALRPDYRGQNLGADVVQVLCHYAFTVRGLQRLQGETLADNAAMIRSATAAGFVPEGTLRRVGWVGGEFADQVVLGLLAGEWWSEKELLHRSP
ncbi:GNAT family N-acetyltransferase [Amycolatopsis sp. GA6-003]|uniref:GNAT family N-acetyltransferase n=1 Tax=Amycolatopsis sp. GA6-003 TaxID=2652444 RepID=UPI00391731F6